MSFSESSVNGGTGFFYDWLKKKLPVHCVAETEVI
jgi:hypothetical protein